MPNALPDDVLLAIAGGEKIEAIRLLREKTGLGLAAAKAAVEAGFLAPSGPVIDIAATTLPPEVSAALAAGSMIDAIRLLRRTRGIGLKEAKDIIDASNDGLARHPPNRAPSLAPGEVPRRRFGAWILLVVTILLAWVTWLLTGNR